MSKFLLLKTEVHLRIKEPRNLRCIVSLIFFFNETLIYSIAPLSINLSKQTFGCSFPYHRLQVNSCKYSRRNSLYVVPFIFLSFSSVALQLLSACWVLTPVAGSTEFIGWDLDLNHQITWRTLTSLIIKVIQISTFTLACPRVSSSLVNRASVIDSRSVVGSNLIWDSDCSQFPLASKLY